MTSSSPLFPNFYDPTFPDIENKRISFFAELLYYIVDDRSTDSIISWAQNGKGFVVWNVDRFCSEFLPKFSLRSHQLSEFMTRLQIFNFKKVEESGQWEYTRDEHFVRGQPELTREIERSVWLPSCPGIVAFLKSRPPRVRVSPKDPDFKAKKEARLKDIADRRAARELAKLNIS